ncbi:hypothetical protein A3D78_02020 [Candidatus Gottesmanbacteria bacterium RIFCSPHIGHO2_02_FULL_39_14]|uniref:Uncharacterized protein n=2 Tax=Candidatus Gottesmaniibacteriota TaxID=1752720 RepID=A0A1F6A279_9BACT|nr:MAG: hypothetical protein A3D78_02020 [Candidatus Gottesmanbacteria bacterium RIFCSPHIGHO2_02_FULL_39_14]OGG30945.1 MAG: hypothetical protein A3I51_02655 [Candidatus Gottesmanbacteria bacterium RIFCSPLOWO2_02_FULL_38_8]
MNKALTKFSHDLKNSLMVIRGNLFFVKKNKGDKSSFTNKIEDRIDKISADLEHYKKEVAKDKNS